MAANPMVVAASYAAFHHSRRGHSMDRPRHSKLCTRCGQAPTLPANHTTVAASDLFAEVFRVAGHFNITLPLDLSAMLGTADGTRAFPVSNI